MIDERDPGANGSLRIDRLLVYLRFARTRSNARAMIERNSVRLNRVHVTRVSENVSVGDVMTLAQDGDVRIIEVLALPVRRTSPATAKQHYRELTRS